MKRYLADLPRTKLASAFRAHRFVYHIGGVTGKKRYPGIEYHLRTNPSAGALYPNELYFQARGVEGFEDGIYHFETGSASAVKLCDIAPSEGLEPFLGQKRPMEGLLFLVSGVWYRSVWKYGDRAFRYCLLDAGHLLGNVEAGALLYGHAWRVGYDIDLAGLNGFFGFDEKEGFLAAAFCAVPRGDVARPPDRSLPRADPLGVAPRECGVVLGAYRDTLAAKACNPSPRFPAYNLHPQAWEEAILKRRSVRTFIRRPISDALYRALSAFVRAPLPSDCDVPLRLYAVVHDVEGMAPGVYRDDRLLMPGDFRKKCAYLCLEQPIGGEGAVTFFLVGDGCAYRPMMQKAGHIGQRIYLMATYLGLGCSGIGAFYDDEVKNFLNDDGMILYALAVGHY